MNQALAMNPPPTGNSNSLPELCKRADLPLRKVGTKWASSVCVSPSCSASSKHSSKFSVFVGSDGRWRFKCMSCGIYGDTADFLAMSRGITVGAALIELSGGRPWVGAGRIDHAARGKAADEDKSEIDKEAVGRVMAKLKAHAFDDGPRSYLHGRGIRNEVIDLAVKTGQLRMLPADPVAARRFLLELIGEPDLVAGGFLRPGKKWPALAFHPIIAMEPSAAGAEFRIACAEKEDTPKAIRYGDMTWPWFLKRNNAPKSFLVVEGFIDLLSAYQDVVEVDAVMGVPGVNGWTRRWFSALYEKYPDATVMVGFDNDDAGNANVDILRNLLGEIGFDHMHYPPPPGLDWNNVTQARVFI